MPLTCSIYTLSKLLSLNEIAGKLEHAYLSAQTLGSENISYQVASAERGEGHLTALLEVYVKGQRLERKLKIRVLNFRGRTYLLALASRRIAGKIARSIAGFLGAEASAVVFQQSRLREIYERKTVRLIVFDMVRIPGLRKVSLSGSSVADTDVFRGYIDVCEVSYVLFEWMGATIGISASGTVVCLSKMDEEAFLKLIIEEVIPIVA